MRVISTGTFLDSLRFRVHLGRHFAVDPAHVEAQVIGDHGTKQVFLWSSARLSGVPIAALMKKGGESLKELRQKLENEVRYANITIIEGHDASQYGIGMVSARIAEMVLRDERAVIPIGSWQEEFGVGLSLPSVVGSSGVSRSFRRRSARAWRKAPRASGGPRTRQRARLTPVRGLPTGRSKVPNWIAVFRKGKRP
jgi:L-lactate dehydrogenase